MSFPDFISGIRKHILNYAFILPLNICADYQIQYSD